MALSICCVTANPGRAAAVLAGLRQFADEIVVAVDVSSGERDLTPLDAVADRLFEIELGTFQSQRWRGFTHSAPVTGFCV